MIHFILALEIFFNSNKQQLTLSLHNGTFIAGIKWNLYVLSNKNQAGFSIQMADLTFLLSEMLSQSKWGFKRHKPRKKEEKQ